MQYNLSLVKYAPTNQQHMEQIKCHPPSTLQTLWIPASPTLIEIAPLVVSSSRFATSAAARTT
nr:MAG TPA: hypothetical protein [Caudoviricetes sp.]